MYSSMLSMLFRLVLQSQDSQSKPPEPVPKGVGGCMYVHRAFAPKVSTNICSVPSAHHDKRGGLGCQHLSAVRHGPRSGKAMATRSNKPSAMHSPRTTHGASVRFAADFTKWRNSCACRGLGGRGNKGSSNSKPAALRGHFPCSHWARLL